MKNRITVVKIETTFKAQINEILKAKAYERNRGNGSINWEPS